MSSIHSEWSSLGHVCPKPSYKWAQRAGVNSFRSVIWPHHRGSLGWWRASWGPQKMAFRTSPKRSSRTGSTGPPRPGMGGLPKKTMPMCPHPLWSPEPPTSCSALHVPLPSCALNFLLPLFPFPPQPLNGPTSPIQNLQTMLLDLQAAPINSSWGADYKPQAL